MEGSISDFFKERLTNYRKFAYNLYSNLRISQTILINPLQLGYLTNIVQYKIDRMTALVPINSSATDDRAKGVGVK